MQTYGDFATPSKENQVAQKTKQNKTKQYDTGKV
jgi:hypothetical protein